MSYSSKLRIEVPASLYHIACNVARALDPDSGGDKSFGPEREAAVTYSTETPCTESFAAKAIMLLASPTHLHAALQADYAARWADLPCPSLEDCEAFCAGATVTDTTKEPVWDTSSQASQSEPSLPGLSDPMTTTST